MANKRGKDDGGFFDLFGQIPFGLEENPRGRGGAKRLSNSAGLYLLPSSEEAMKPDVSESANAPEATFKVEPSQGLFPVPDGPQICIVCNGDSDSYCGIYWVCRECFISNRFNEWRRAKAS
jgi:hypothetical protein